MGETDPKIAPAEQEKEAISEILRNKEVKEIGSETHYILRYGGRKLTVKFIHPIDLIQGYLKNEELPVPRGATTLLFKAAKQLMDEVASKEQTYMKYEFSTELVSMAIWAKTEGQNIFNWTNKLRAVDLKDLLEMQAAEEKFLVGGETGFSAQIMPQIKT